MNTKETISLQARSIVNASARKINSTNLSELIHTLLHSMPLNLDMSVIESATIQVLKNNGISFYPYMQLFPSAEEKADISRFDTISDYFFNEISKPKITVGRIEYLVKLCINI